MVWYEVIEDLGDGSSATRRFKTWEEADLYVEENIDYCPSGYDTVDTDSNYFWYNNDD